MPAKAARRAPCWWPATTAKVDATAEAIAIARALVARREQVVLVDLTRGPASVSGALGLPRTPGLTDLVAGRAGFEDVVRIDEDSLAPSDLRRQPETRRHRTTRTSDSGRLFEALTQAYDCVVLHADREAVRQLTPALKFELPIVVAVLPSGASDSGTKTDLAEFSALGCPVLVYEQTGKKPRSRLLRARRCGLSGLQAPVQVPPNRRARSFCASGQRCGFDFDRALEARPGCERQRQGEPMRLERDEIVEQGLGPGRPIVPCGRPSRRRNRRSPGPRRKPPRSDA